MQDQISVSVIVPVYNAEKYIGECIASLKKQSCKNAEFIIINDGSTDNSLEKIKSACGDDSRFKVINQGNFGVSAARNRGLKEAEGKYLMFVDADDMLMDPKSLAFLCGKMDATEAGVLAFGSIDIRSDGKQRIRSFPEKEEIINTYPDQLRASLKTINNGYYRSSVWNKIYNTSLVRDNEVRFENYSDVVSEDKLFNFIVFLHAEKVILESKILYKHNLLENSVSHSKQQKDVLKRVENTIRIATTELQTVRREDRAGLFWAIYLDCISICMKFLYSVNKDSSKNVKKGIVHVLKHTESIRFQYDDGKKHQLSGHKLKNDYYRFLCALIRKGAYKKVAMVLLTKSRILRRRR